MRAPHSALLACALLLLASPAAAQTITGCGATVNGVGTLANDLDCTGDDFPAVRIAKGSLVMNGFTITGQTVLCDGKCRIQGPGRIEGGVMGISAYGNLDLRQVDVVDHDYLGVQCYRDCKITGPASIDNNNLGVTSTAKIKLDNVSITNNAEVGAKARQPNITGRVQAKSSTFTGNGLGILAARGVKLHSSSVTGNLKGGVSVGEEGCTGAGSVTFKATAIGGNGFDGVCGVTEACADLLTCQRPKLGPGSSCGTSYVNGSGLPGSNWGVCSSD